MGAAERLLLDQHPERAARVAEGRLTGVALSGGGIRSATFCLGVFQALASARLLDRIDVLSTVSGGGYFGAFLGRLYTRDYVTSASQVEAVLTGRPLDDHDRRALDEDQRRNLERARDGTVQWLRENGRYLSPRGSGDLLLGGAVLFRNWVAVHVVLIALGLFAFLLMQAPRVTARNWCSNPSAPPLRIGPVDVQAMFCGAAAAVAGVRSAVVRGLPGEDAIWWSPWVVPVVVSLVALVMPAGWAYWLISVPRAAEASERDPRTRRRTRGGQFRRLLWRSGLWQVGGCAFAIAVAWIALMVLPPEPVAPRLFFRGLRLVGTLTLVFWIVGLWVTVTRWARETNQEGTRRSVTRGVLVAGLVLLAIVIALGDVAGAVENVVVAGLLFGALWYAHRASVARRNAGGEPRPTLLFLDNEARHTLSAGLKWALVVTAALAAVAAIDSLAQTLYAVSAERDGALRAWIGGLLAAFAGIAAFGRQIVVLLGERKAKGRPRLPVAMLATAVALVLAATMLTLVDAVAHAVAWNFGPTPFRSATAGVGSAAIPVGAAPPSGPFWFLTAAAGMFALLLGRSLSFLNRSAHGPLYGARLTRAYLGASNPARLGGNVPVIEPIRGDDLELEEYWPVGDTLSAGAYRKGAPLHLINVTINETVDGQSQLQQQDRKGVGLALGPAGVSAGIRHHVVFDLQHAADRERIAAIFPEKRPGRYRVFEYPDREFPCEPLSLGRWIGISGAAFSTGTGYRTSLGLSLLTGFGNVRLGHWWNSGVDPSNRDGVAAPRAGLSLALGWSARVFSRLFPVQTYLLHEFLARFPGTSRRLWYLSDGGHFENMGAYELIRRRLPFMIVVDAEADPDYAFEGLSNLVRKARLDFGAEVTFLDREALARVLDPRLVRWFGTLDDLRRGAPRQEPVDAPHAVRAPAHAALASIAYDGGDEPESWLLYLKPTLTGDEPVDVRQYQRAHAEFPQETTSDQFFDEAQWESYRKLGEHIAARVFARTDVEPGKWAPCLFRAPTPAAPA